MKHQPRNPDSLISRRALLFGVGAACVGLVAARSMLAATPPASQKGSNVRIENFSPAGKSQGVATVPRVVKTDEEWSKQLSPASYRVTRHEGTEWAFSGEYNGSHEDGLYRCICCSTALFDSKTKFESGTGWPSFYQAISKHNVRETDDRSLGVSRTAVSCSRCDAHLGHVFPDGPRPTGLRYCMNSVALTFVSRAVAKS